MIGRIPDVLAEVLFPLITSWKFTPTEQLFLKIRVTAEGKWLPGGSIEIPSIYEIYGPKLWKKSALKLIKFVNVNYFIFLILSSQLCDSCGAWAYLRVGEDRGEVSYLWLISTSIFENF